MYAIGGLRLAKLLWTISLALICITCVSNSHPPVYLNRYTEQSLSQLLKSSSSLEQSTELYTAELKKWTRHNEVFNHFEGRLFVSATLITPSFEVARSRYHQYILQLNEPEFLALTQQRHHYSQQHYIFFLTLSSSDLPKLQKASSSKQSFDMVRGTEDELKVHLIINGQRFSPNKIDLLSFKRAQSLIDDFPYISSVKTGYWIHFTVPSKLRYNRLERDTHKIALRFASIPATAMLEWDVIIDQ